MRILRFTATYDLAGQRTSSDMEYNTDDVKSTLTRRLKNAFPSASNIVITEKEDPQLELNKSNGPRGARS